MKQFNKSQVITQSLKVFNAILLISSVALLYSCATATGSSIITGTKRPAINPSDVKIYIDPPKQYETIGVIEVSSTVMFSRQGAQDKAMNELKSKAAKVGANGLLLTNTGSQSTSGGYYSNGIYYGDSSDKIVAQGKAIYVIQE